MAKPSMEKLISELEKWIKKPSNKDIVLELSLRQLNGYLAGEVKSPIGQLSGAAMWYGKYGASLVLQNDSDGWKHIQRALLYRAWNDRILFAALDKTLAQSVSILFHCLPLVHSVACREDGFALWVGNRLLTAANSRDKRISGWDKAPFEPFSVKLFALWRKTTVDYSGLKVHSLGVYQRLLDTWESEQPFASALKDACEYHLQRTRDDDDTGYPEFYHPLYDVFPAEILAIQRVRKDQGLPVPAIDHPLMRTPLAHPPDTMPEFHDELLDKVIAKARAELPIGDPW